MSTGFRGVKLALVTRRRVLSDLRKPVDQQLNAKLRTDLADEWEPLPPCEDPRFPRRAKREA